MSISMNYGRTGQNRAHQNPETAFKAAEGKYHDAACDLSEGERYPKVHKGEDKHPFVVRGSAG